MARQIKMARELYIGKAVRICYFYNSRFYFPDFLFCLLRIAFQRRTIWCAVRQGALEETKDNMDLVAAFCLFMETSPINLFYLAETEIR